MKRLIIVSAGALGREIYAWALQENRLVRGFLDDRSDILEGKSPVHPIIGTVQDYQPEEGDFFVCAIGDPATKKSYCDILDAKGAKWATLIHPSAVVGQDVLIGEGSVIGPLCQLSCDIKLGRHVFFGTHSNTAHDTRFGDYAQVSGSCEINGRAEIGEGAFLGSHATILPDAKVGAWAYVGAGSVVLRRVPDHAKVFGNPAVSIYEPIPQKTPV